MGWLERTHYPHFDREFAPDVLRARFTPTPQEVAFVFALSEQPSYRLSAMLLLKGFQALRYFPQLDKIPEPIVRHVRSALKMDARVALGYRQLATPSRHRTAIRAYLGVRECDQSARDLATDAMRHVTHAGAELTDLINAGVRKLLDEERELPAFSTLVRLARVVHAERNQRVTQLGFRRRELVDLLSSDEVFEPEQLREVAQRALERVDAKIHQLEQTRGRLHALLDNGTGSLDRIAVLDALCIDDDLPRAPLGGDSPPRNDAHSK